ncbi:MULTISPECIES: purine-nucleoside phosphorylase [unclassified Pseudoalteromonas]|uniref:purine-nucleoside phosphorylase n=1 Tax=unclassified Pseudoalteromonas TaxID=194690 RepID=UPI0020984638|nr:purine-nucleoside phosphorylase [Pseudoalteromonas sp. XMcav2-N]MCO7188283.1 purine-nucleoside phosphorylase [Pseudoalteromonas sp. XMcav2-N]
MAHHNHHTTVHINAAADAFADTVLLPGDPLRAKFIAEHFLTDVKVVNTVRNMLGYTGYYQDHRISVMGTGMGIPSCSIYAKELITEYGVQNLIRVGSCGAVSEQVQLRDIIVAMGACTDSKVNRLRFKDHDFAAIADFNLLNACVKSASELALEVQVGNVFSSDLFYTPQPDMFDLMDTMGILGVEMEAAGLYGVAAQYGARALTILTVADHITQDIHLSSDARQSSFEEMIQLALLTAQSV